MRRVTALAALFLAAGPAAALADPIPAYLPTRDVAVTYQITREGEADRPAIVAHLFYAHGHLRVEQDGIPGYALIDEATKQVTVVMTQNRITMTLPFDPDNFGGFFPRADMRFTREGNTVFDGLPCTEWRVTSDRGEGHGCLTPDGVLLHGQGHEPGRPGYAINATAVGYGHQPASLFEPPEGYRAMPLLTLPGGKR